VTKLLRRGHPNVYDVIADRTVDAVINTVTGNREVLQDGFHIRRAAVDMRIPCFTSMDTARAAVESMVGGGIQYSVKPLRAYLED
jgi:carbamoyl-phosphate synthase large subunit